MASVFGRQKLRIFPYNWGIEISKDEMEIINVFKHALVITFFVFVMMLVVDFIDSTSKGRMSEIIKGGPWRQYTLASLLGSTPGCLGAFMNVSLYVHDQLWCNRGGHDCDFRR